MKKLMVVGAAFAFMGVAAVELPDGYTAVDWIESTKGGKQFIDTGYIANGLTKVVFDVRIPERGTGQQGDDFGVLFGACTMNDSPANAFALQMCDGSTGGNNVRFIYNDANRQSDDKPFSYGERVTVTCDGQHFEWTGSKSANVEFGADPLDHSKSTLYIFAGNMVSGDGGTKDTDGTYHSVMRLYSFKIIEGQKVIRDFVPCVRVRDQAAGLYDLAESEPVNAFYANAGTGAFDVPRVPVDTTQKIDFHSMTYDTQSIYQNVTNSMGYDIGTRLRQNYLFLAPFNMSNSESSDDAFYKMAIGAAVSVVAYYFPGLGCYEFRVTRAETGCVMNYELFRWNNVNGKIRQTRLCAHCMGGKGLDE